MNTSLPYYNVLNTPTRQIIDIGDFFRQTGLYDALNIKLKLDDTLQEKIMVIEGIMMLLKSYDAFKEFVASDPSN